MVVLAYLWVLVLVPLLLDEKDHEVRWHVKHGLVLMAGEFMLWVGIQIVLFGAGVLGLLLTPLIFVASVLVRIACIVRGVKGERFEIPVLTPLVDRF